MLNMLPHCGTPLRYSQTWASPCTWHAAIMCRNTQSILVSTAFLQMCFTTTHVIMSFAHATNRQAVLQARPHVWKDDCTLDGRIKTPRPSRWLSTKDPSNMSSFVKKHVPLPCRLPHSQPPSYTSPLVYSSRPNPWRVFLWKVPMYISPFGMYSVPVPCLWPCVGARHQRRARAHRRLNT
jgi:hypothetical protein